MSRCPCCGFTLISANERIVELEAANDDLKARVVELQRNRDLQPLQSPDDLRKWGWSVAVHNDYRQDGQQYTFWLFTHPDGRWLKGEGQTDAAALNQVRAQVIAGSRRETTTTLKGTVDGI